LLKIECCYFVAMQIICLKPIKCIKLLAKGFLKKYIKIKSINRQGSTLKPISTSIRKLLLEIVSVWVLELTLLNPTS
jgi:hypothetical protein